MTGGAVAGALVLDFTRTIPGRLATALLGQLGADVTTVQQPGSEALQALPVFQLLGPGKDTVVLDLKDASDLAHARQLATEADVVVEGFRPGVMARLGLGYDDISAKVPVVDCSISGFGQSGPLVNKAGTDITYMALTGHLDRQRNVDGTLVRGAPSVRVGDLTGGLMAAVSILAVLSRPERSPVHLDMALSDAAPVSGILELANSLAMSPDGEGSAPLPTTPLYRLYDTSDGRAIAIAITGDRVWKQFCDVAGLAALRDRTMAQLMGDTPGLEATLETLFASDDLSGWVARLDLDDLPFAPVARLDEAIRNPAFRGVLSGSGTLRFPLGDIVRDG